MAHEDLIDEAVVYEIGKKVADDSSYKPNSDNHTRVWLAAQAGARAAFRHAGEQRGLPVTDWSWWVGTDESVQSEGLYDLNECYSREDAVTYGAEHVEQGGRFHIVEARCRELNCDDEFQPFAASRNAAVFEVGPDATATEVGK